MKIICLNCGNTRKEDFPDKYGLIYIAFEEQEMCQDVEYCQKCIMPNKIKKPRKCYE